MGWTVIVPPLDSEKVKCFMVPQKKQQQKSATLNLRDAETVPQENLCMTFFDQYGIGLII